MEGQTSYVPETVAQTSIIHFEPGIHPQQESEIRAVNEKFSQGDLNAHFWNTEVSEQIASYAYDTPALLLTIDGLEPIPPNSQAPLFTPLQEAGMVWKDLPARPNKLHQTGKVYVVKGDSYNSQIPHAVLSDMKTNTDFYSQMAAKDHTEIEKAHQAYDTAIIGETGIIASLGFALWGASKLMAPSAESQQLSRRRFLDKTLKFAVATAVGGSLLRYPLPNLIANLPNEPSKEFLQTVNNIVRPRLTRSTYNDGRTALLLAKAEDAQATSADLSQTTNVVVMGSLHEDMVPTYLTDKGERNTAIAAYARELLATAQEVYASYFHVSFDQIPPQVTQSLLNYVSQVDIVAVTDPGGSLFQPNFPSTVDKQVTPYMSFNSPQVEGAISSLYPQQ